MLGRREFIDRLARAIAGTMLGAALVWRVPKAGHAVVARYLKCIVYGPPLAGRFICRQETMDKLLEYGWVTLSRSRLPVINAAVTPDIWALPVTTDLDGLQVVVVPWAAKGGPHWVPAKGRPFTNRLIDSDLSGWTPPPLTKLTA